MTETMTEDKLYFTVNKNGYRVWKDKIEDLGEKDIFVFGSNPQGRHGKGAASYAVKKFGAIYGQGRGLQGNSYGLITKHIGKTPFREVISKDIEDTRIIEYNESGYRSILPYMMIDNIMELYKVDNCTCVY